MANIKSVATDFEPNEKKEMVSYWDTKGIKADQYTGSLVLKYGDKSQEKKVMTTVGNDRINVEIIGVTGYAVSDEMRSPVSSSPIAIAAILLAIVNIGWFVFYFVTRKK